MIDEIDPILPAQGTVATKVSDSTSITAEPDRAWVAERQDAITSALEQRNETPMVPVSKDDDAAAEHQRHPGRSQLRLRETEVPVADGKLSGESQRIGTGNWDDGDVPFVSKPFPLFTIKDVSKPPCSTSTLPTALSFQLLIS